MATRSKTRERLDAAAILEAKKFCGLSRIVDLIEGRLDCQICGGSGEYPRLKYADGRVDEKKQPRPCGFCHGSGKQTLSAQGMVEAALELEKFRHAQKKAVEMSDPEGEAVQKRYVVEYVEARRLPAASEDVEFRTIKDGKEN